MLGRLLMDHRQHGGSLTIRGAPGVGKSVLLDAFAVQATAAGWQVLRTAGTPSERELPLAALHRLLQPVMHALPSIKPAQRKALSVAFGLLDDDRPEMLHISLAALDLLTEVAADRPVAILVDDTQWLDHASESVLAFVARRLDYDPIFLVAAGRDLEDDLFGDGTLPQLELGSLDAASASLLLDAAAPDLDATTRRRLLDAAGGNPLALLELPRALDEGGDGRLSLGMVSLTTRLERAFAERASRLSVAAQDVLLLTALSDSSTITEIVQAASLMGSSNATVADLDTAVAAGLLQTEELTARFRHPLVRSAIYQSATAGRRRAAHAALADVLANDLDRQVWHRAFARIEPDDEVAGQLEAAALRAWKRGLVPTAVQAFERAAVLSETGSGRARRLLMAAELAQDVGQFELSARALRATDPLPLGSGEKLRAEWVRELLDEAMQGGVRRVGALIDLSARARRHGNPELACRFLLRAASRCWHIDLGRDVERQVIAATDRLTLDAADPRRIAILAYAAPLRRGADLGRLLAQLSPEPGRDPMDLLLLGHAAACIGAFQEAEAFCDSAARGLRDQGRLAPLCQALSLLAWSALRRGRWSVAIPAADECVRLSNEARQPIHEVAGLAAQAMIAAIRGDEDNAMTLASRAESLALPTGNTIGLAIIQLARGTAAAGAERPQAAYEAFRRIYRRTDVAHQRMQAVWAIGSYAEAAVDSGHREEAVAELAQLTELAAPTAGNVMALRLARMELADPGQVEGEVIDAQSRDVADWPFEQGRMLLAHGRRLRRRRQIKSARVQLRAARDAFDSIDARPWSDRARRELRAAGEASAQPPPNAWNRLSPQEMHIAQLVAEGLGNKEIGERLYLSPRTVASHLYRMFPKLNITSRTQLIGLALGDTTSWPG